MPIVDDLYEVLNGFARFSYPFRVFKNSIPSNGIYILFEKGESYKAFDRAVRVGSHDGSNQLFPRLTQHFENKNKNRSIFRKNIGRCLLNKAASDYLRIWDLDTTSRKNKELYESIVDKEFELRLEDEISEYIQSDFSFCVIEETDKESRLYWESKIASTLAASSSKPSSSWLGNFSPKEKIRSSGLWQENKLNLPCLTENELNELKIKGR